MTLTTPARPVPPPPSSAETAAPTKRPRWWRTTAATVLTVLAAALVYLALITPDNVSRLPPGSSVPQALVRIPLEAIVAVAVLLSLPARWRDRVALALGAALGVLSILKVIDMGFYAVLARPFDPVLDWVLFGDGFNYLSGSYGRGGAIGVVVGAVVAALLLVALMTAAVRRLARIAAAHRVAASGTAVAALITWTVCALLVSHFVSTVTIASDSAMMLAFNKARKVPQSITDRRTFAEQAAVDAFRDVPGERLLAGLRGKDVVVAFVESYGRTAVDMPEVAPGLADGGRRLGAAGYAMRSGWLTSPTVGGGSWLAHATLHSGLWADNEQRYRTLMASDRLTLPAAFARAGWRTVGVEPGIFYPWPEGKIYDYDIVYDSHTLGYRGPKFGWSSMPDQYVLDAFRRLEHGRTDRGPLMAEVTLTSSHSPWTPVPRMVPWNAVGDGSGYGPMVEGAESAEQLWSDGPRLRAAYATSVAYSMESLVSYATEFGDDDLVLIILGDHQPAPVVIGDITSRDVPITIISRDRTVVDRIAGWGWQDGLKPDPQGPVMPMNAFRDAFLTAFGR